MAEYLMHFNPYHSKADGRFTSGGSGSTVSRGKSKEEREKAKTEKYIKREMKGITRRRDKALANALQEKRNKDFLRNDIIKRKNQHEYEARRKEIYANARKEYNKVKNYKMSDVKKERMYVAKQWVKDLAYRNAVSFFTGRPTYSDFRVSSAKQDYRLYS